MMLSKLQTRPVAGLRSKRLVVLAGQRDDRSRKGAQFEGKNRRRGRPAWMRSPYDTPLRDGNRDRLIGLLTERAAKTLMVYLMETNVNVYSWLVAFYKSNPIPKQGSWDEVSGEAFLRKLLSMPIEEAKYNTGRDSLFDNVASCGVDPRSIAQRIMDIRSQLSEEFIQELQAIAEENALLLRETLNSSLMSSFNSLDEASSESDTPQTPTGNSGSSSSNGDSSSPFTTNGTTRQRDQDSSSSRSREDISLRPSFGPKNLKKPRQPLPPLFSDIGAGSSNDAEKAAAVAALNAALRAALPAEYRASHPELLDVQDQQQVVEDTPRDSSSSSDSQMDIQDVFSQLQQSMAADVAALYSLNDAGTDPSLPLPPPAAALEDLPTWTDEDTAAPVAGGAAAAAADDDGVLGQQQAADSDGQSGPHFNAASACLAAALPKGWGPRLGPGFSSINPARNNIVSSAKLVSAMTAAALSSVDGGPHNDAGSSSNSCGGSVTNSI